MTDDAELLRQYADNRSDEAFAELVQRHVDLVYSAALRRCLGNHHRAQEVTQMVFVDLARKAAALADHPVLAAWLHRSSHLAALDLARREGRRQKYERAAGTEAKVMGTDPQAVAWEEVGPVLDQALDGLSERDRQAILLRFFGNQPFGEVGQRLRISENAARMRVERALETLNRVLARRGITSSSAALAAALSSNAVVGAPAGVAASSAAAVASVAGGAGLGWLAFMSTSKLPLAVCAAVLLGGAAVVGVQDHSARTSAAEIAGLDAQNASIPGLESRHKALSKDDDLVRSLRDEAASVGILRGQVRELETAAGEAQAAAARKGSVRAPKLDGSQPIFDLSKLDQRPAVLSQHRPEYPQQMIQAGAAGEALVDFVVGSDGVVYNATAVTSTDKAFADSAVQAVSQWVFKPGQVGGQNVYTHMQVPIVFTLSSDPPPPPSAASWF